MGPLILPGSVRFRRVQEYGSSLSSSGMGHPCSPTINFTATLQRKHKQNYCVHLYFFFLLGVCSILGGEIF